MNKEMLQKFCATRQRGSYELHNPFSMDEWTYASNGHICVRVPRLSDVPDNEKAPGKQCCNMFINALSRPVNAWQDLPPFKLKIITCSECGGTGYVKMCPAFDNGGVDCTNGTGKQCKQHNEECATSCNQSDKGAKACEECEGSGKRKLTGKTIVDGSICRVRISEIYLDKIKDLPNIRIAPYDAESFFLFRFDGGEGLLMPMRI